VELEAYIVTTEFTGGLYFKPIQSSLHPCIVFPCEVVRFEGRGKKERQKEEKI
jgi:hypothetical protein